MVLMEGFSLRLFFPSQRESRCSVPNMIFGLLPYGGAYKITVLSVCLSISSLESLSEMDCYFFRIFCTMLDNWNI